MNEYKHSVLLDAKKCTGCTTCLKHCPTEAIRIKNGHAVIDGDRCIDCGECIRNCPHQAKKAVYSQIEAMNAFKYKIALPAPTLYGQFEEMDDIDYVLNGLLKIGFDDVFEVSKAAELVSAYTRMYLRTEGIKKPIISSACPVIVRLIQLRFSSLCGNVLHMLPPMEVAARLARKRALENHPELKDEDIGVCFISPCPAKVSYVTNGFADYKSKVDVVVSISDIYFKLLNEMKRDKSNLLNLCESGIIGLNWASSSGEATAIFNEKYLAADGIENVIRVLDQLENGNISQLDFIELNACPGGCVGGVLNIQNPFIARARLRTLRRGLPVSRNSAESDDYIPDGYLFDDLPEYAPITRLGDNLAESMRMMADIQKIKSELPNIDCGACGAPNCRAFAEDIVKGRTNESACPILKVGKTKGVENDGS